jgi:hypothetical protein
MTTKEDIMRVAKQTRNLIDSYPAREAQDAEVYAAAISSVFWKYPPDIGWLAIDIITSRLRFLPTRADLFQVMEELVSKRRGKTDPFLMSDATLKSVRDGVVTAPHTLDVLAAMREVTVPLLLRHIDAQANEIERLKAVAEGRLQ